MASRVENVMNVVIQGGQSERVDAIRIPNSATLVQIVLDNTRFEDVTTREQVLVDIWAFVGGRGNGHLQLGGGRSDDIRPGQRMLWSFGAWRLRPSRSTRRLDVLLEASVTMGATVHVDFFP